MNPPIPAEEPQRLKALEEFDILDTPAERGFDRITELTSRFFKVPITAISVVAKDRQWFKSRIGLDVPETSRRDAFCAYTIMGTEVMVVEDARNDPRFAQNPLVTGESAIRFYAAAPLTSSDGYRLGTLCILDRTPRTLSHLERELLADLATMVVERFELRRAARRVEKLASPRGGVGSLFANMSHEFRTPLNSVLGFARLLLNTPNLCDQERQYLKTINRNAEHLLSLINDVLEMCRIEAGRGILNSAPCLLAGLAEELSLSFRGLAEKQGLELVTDLAPNLPACVLVDETKLRQVLLNLLGNAVKFTEKGRIELRVRSEPAKTGSVLLRFEIADTGIGLDAGEQDLIFSPFSQTTEGSQRAAGSGLGLAIARDQVRLMGGELEVESTRGDGSVFRFSIDAELFIPDGEAAKVEPSQPVALAPGHENTRVLIAEDNEGNRSLLANMLRPLGFDVCAAANGQEAIAACAEFRPQIILMDLRMPEVDGVEAIRQIREQEYPTDSPVTIIGVSAAAFEAEAELMMAAGCDAFVRKPFRSSDLLETIREHSGIEYQLGPAER